MDRGVIKHWLTQVQPTPVAAEEIRAFETNAGVKLPLAFVEHMLARNGGLVRVGRTFWALAPIPPGNLSLAYVMWSGKRISDMIDILRVFEGWPDFPSGAIPIAICLNRGSPGPVLYLQASPSDQVVWSWSWDSSGGVRLLDDIDGLWRDDPRTMPDRICDWKVEALRLPPGEFSQYVTSKKMIDGFGADVRDSLNNPDRQQLYPQLA